MRGKKTLFFQGKAAASKVFHNSPEKRGKGEKEVKKKGISSTTRKA